MYQEVWKEAETVVAATTFGNIAQPQPIVGVAKMHLHSICILQAPAQDMVFASIAPRARRFPARVASRGTLG